MHIHVCVFLVLPKQHGSGVLYNMHIPSIGRQVFGAGRWVLWWAAVCAVGRLRWVGGLGFENVAVARALLGACDLFCVA